MAKRKVREEGVKKRGEVFTPPLLAEEMVSTIPFDKIGIDETILDPCVGATFVFPIFYMFKWVERFGVENISHFINKCLYVGEINPIALEYGQYVFHTYTKMLVEKGVEFTRQHYIDNFDNIVNNYYDYCELDETEI